MEESGGTDDASDDLLLPFPSVAAGPPPKLGCGTRFSLASRGGLSGFFRVVVDLPRGVGVISPLSDHEPLRRGDVERKDDDPLPGFGPRCRSRFCCGDRFRGVVGGTEGSDAGEELPLASSWPACLVSVAFALP